MPLPKVWVPTSTPRSWSLIAPDRISACSAAEAVSSDAPGAVIPFGFPKAVETAPPSARRGLSTVSAMSPPEVSPSRKNSTQSSPHTQSARRHRSPSPQKSLSISPASSALRRRPPTFRAKSFCPAACFSISQPPFSEVWPKRGKTCVHFTCKKSLEFRRKNIRIPPKKCLTNIHASVIITHAFGRLAQLVEHPLDVRKVAGSSPTSSTILEKSELEAGWQRVRISCFHRADRRATLNG